jgi:hypothetical protein
MITHRACVTQPLLYRYGDIIIPHVFSADIILQVRNQVRDTSTTTASVSGNQAAYGEEL